MTNNVISFPKKSKQKTPEEIARNIKAAKAEQIEMLCLDLTDLILSELAYNGIEIESLTQEHLKDFGLLMESTKALISRHYNEPHFLHKLTDNMFETVGDDLFFSSSNTIVIAKGEVPDGPVRP